MCHVEKEQAVTSQITNILIMYAKCAHFVLPDGIAECSLFCVFVLGMGSLG